MDEMIYCKHCRRRMTVYSTREETIGGFLTLLRRRKCPVHDQYRTASLELPKELAMEVLSDD